MPTIAELLCQELGQKLEYIENVIALMDEGNTIPFIARYRKEMHGAMDDTVLRALETRLNYLRNLRSLRMKNRTVFFLTHPRKNSVRLCELRGEKENIHK